MDDTSHLRALLKNRDCACPGCGYNLRGLTGECCPECGKAVDPTAVLSQRHRLDYAWLLMLLSFTAALPWSVFYVWQRLIIRGRLFYGIDWNPATQAFGRGITDRPLWEGVLMLLSSVWWLSVPFVCVALIVFRRKIANLPRVVRWGFAMLCVVMLLLAFRRWQWWWWASGLSNTRWEPYDFWYLTP